jgi:alpha amylase-like protein
MVTDVQAVDAASGRHFPVRNALIRSYQYLIAKFDVDGFRIDTLKYIEPEFAQSFGNSMREFALSIGKKNFFTFGEVYDNEEQIARFIGRQVTEQGDLVGVDAALDFPLFFKLPAGNIFARFRRGTACVLGFRHSLPGCWPFHES